MATNLTIALASGYNGFVPGDDGQVKEELTVTGSSSSANDTGTYTSIMKQPARVVCGAAAATISGQTVTFTDLVGLGSKTVGATLYGTA